MKKIFIDANIFLAFYEFTKDDLQQLKKLIGFLKRGEVELYLPQQVIDEFKRRRAGTIKKSYGKLKSLKLSFGYPKICEGYEEYSKLRDLQKEYGKIHEELLKKIENDILSEKLEADKIISEIFENSKLLKVNEYILKKAERRVSLGNPPGKGNNLGDAVNWEALLYYIPEGEEIYLITNDSDFKSPIEENRLNEFLLEEWNKIKKSKIHFYTNLTTFFNEHFPNITLKNEEDIQKEQLISELFNSQSFAQTHIIINKLNKFEDFTIDQVNSILEAYLTNTQILWIINDHDVKSFILRIIKGKENKLDQNNLEQLYKRLEDQEGEENL